MSTEEAWLRCLALHLSRRNRNRADLSSDKERLGSSVESTQGLYYSFEGTVDIGKHLAVPEAYNGKTALFDQLGAPVILGCLIQVMASVELDYKSRLRACKVRDEVSDRELSPEPELTQPLRS
jgi:hypothetical protein